MPHTVNVSKVAVPNGRPNCLVFRLRDAVYAGPYAAWIPTMPPSQGVVLPNTPLNAKKRVTVSGWSVGQLSHRPSTRVGKTAIRIASVPMGVTIRWCGGRMCVSPAQQNESGHSQHASQHTRLGHIRAATGGADDLLIN
jgi:hypothetical protein